MQREIKFRIWDKDNKCFLVRRQIKVSGTEVWVYSLPEIEKEPMYCENTLEWCIDHQFQDEGFCVMQYTGLKDKNRKWVWEGDILKTGEDFIGEVIYEVDSEFGTAQWQIKVGTFDDGSDNIEAICEPFKVIGNIYENPELLK